MSAKLTRKVVTITTITIKNVKNDTVINLTEDGFKLAPEYGALPEKIKEKVDDVIPRLLVWTDGPEQFEHEVYDNGPTRSYWDCDSSSFTWEEARESMGTSCDKFSLTEFVKDRGEARQVARFFSTFGFRPLICRYSPWRKGYDYVIYDMDSYHSEYSGELGEDDIEHVCLAFWRA